MPDNKNVFKDEVNLPETTVSGLLGAAADKKSKAKTRLINIAKQNKKFKDDKSFQAARDKELKDYRAAVASGIKEGLSEASQERGNILNKVKKITSKTMKKDAAFKLRSGNKPSIAKFMGVERLEDIKEKLNPGLNKENVKKIEKGIKDYDDKKLKGIVERNLDNYHFRNVAGSPGADSVRAVLNKMGLFDKRK